MLYLYWERYQKEEYSMKKRTVLYILSVTLILSFGTFSEAFAEDALTFEQQNFISNFDKNNPVEYKEHELEQETTSKEARRKRSSLPSNYNLDHSIGTPIKNQKNLNICWAYSAMALAEHAISSKDSDMIFSEYYLDYLTAKDATETPEKNPYVLDRRRVGGVGNTNEILPLFIQDKIPILNENFIINNYYDKVSIETFYRNSDADIASFVKIPSNPNTDEAKENKINLLKEMIINNGAVTYNYNTNIKQNISDITGTINNKVSNGTNHTTVLVGWDDSFDKNHFKVSPENNGAFIMKNSWGTGFGDSGYYYVSYEDSYLFSEELASISEAYKNKQYENKYISIAGAISSYTSDLNYDESVAGNNARKYNSIVYANNFKVSDLENEKIEGVSLNTNNSNLKYEIYINPNGTEISNFSKLLKVASGTKIHPGTERIKIDKDKQPSINSRDEITVAIKFIFDSQNEKMKIGYGQNKQFDNKKNVTKSTYFWYNSDNDMRGIYPINSEYSYDINLYTDTEKWEITSDTDRVEVGQSIQLGMSSDLHDLSSWKISNPYLALISPLEGVLTGVRPGNLVVTARPVEQNRVKERTKKMMVFNTFDSALEINDDRYGKYGIINDNGDDMYYTFTASESADYVISSMGAYPISLNFSLYDENKKLIKEDSGMLSFDSQKDKKYYVRVSSINGKVGSFNFHATKDNGYI